MKTLLRRCKLHIFRTSVEAGQCISRVDTLLISDKYKTRHSHERDANATMCLLMCSCCTCWKCHTDLIAGTKCKCSLAYFVRIAPILHPIVEFVYCLMSTVEYENLETHPNHRLEFFTCLNLIVCLKTSFGISVSTSRLSISQPLDVLEVKLTKSLGHDVKRFKSDF